MFERLSRKNGFLGITIYLLFELILSVPTWSSSLIKSVLGCDNTSNGWLNGMLESFENRSEFRRYPRELTMFLDT